MASSTRFVWIDLEMTGLDPESCTIVEIGVILTGPELQPLVELERAIWQPEDVLARMDPTVREMHTKSGLLDRVRKSRVGMREAEKDVLSLISSHCRPGEGFLAGNSIHKDRAFLARYMPAVERYLHYRQIDVSTLKVLATAWYGEPMRFVKGDKSHTALDDLRYSIAELRFYRSQMLRA
jgi:oligoribonuclease